VPDVTLKGIGAARADVVLDFAAQVVGDDGVTVTSDGFSIEHLSIRNTPGNGILVTGAEDVRFSDIAVSWDAGSVVDNGAYAIYPTKSTRVLVENSEVVGAADAGIYVGQCNQALVRDNVVWGNVAGIEIENTLDAEVVGNEAYDNTAGILVFVLPNLEVKEGMRCKVHDNDVHDNNRDNFAEPGTVVASVPAGTGILLLAADDTEIHDNVIADNVSTGILMASFSTFQLLSGSSPDPETDAFLEKTYIHDNAFSGNGTGPRDALELLGLPTLEDVVWDGEENPDNASGAELCLGPNPPSFRDFAGVPGIGDMSLHSTDTTPYECVGITQQSVDL
jgi:parallel beta-helix repeat protein